jgi:hypothetical protein
MKYIHNMEKSNEKFPSEWFGGKYMGSIKKTKISYILRISSITGVSSNTTFNFKFYGGEEEALRLVEAKKKEDSDKFGLTTNKMRYIDKNTVEVNLTNGKTCFVDAQFVDFVEQYKLYAKEKKDGNTSRHYATCQFKKKQFPFTDLICDYKIVQYIDGNTLNLRLSNLKEFGSVKLEKAIVEKSSIDSVVTQYDFFKMDISKLPHNIWLLGKPAGTIFKRNGSNVYSVRVEDNEGIGHTKTFNIDKYQSDEQAYEDALKWKINTSYEFDVTKNLIRLLSNDVIQIKLNNETMVTDKIFIPLVQKISLFEIRCSYKSNINGKTYCGTMINSKLYGFHRIITRFKMVDHMNHNTLDNRLINLRHVDHSENNRNKTTKNNITGIDYQKDIGTYGSYRARSKFFGREQCKMIYCDDNSKETMEHTQKIAELFKVNMYNIDVNTNEINVMSCCNEDDILFTVQYLTMVYSDSMKNVCYDVTKYISKYGKIDIMPEEIKKMHQKYVYIQMCRLSNIEKKICILGRYLRKLNGEEIDIYKFSHVSDIFQKDFSKMLNFKLQLCDDELEKNTVKTITHRIKGSDSNIAKLLHLKNSKLKLTHDDGSMEIICGKGHTFYCTLNDITNKGTWCYQCTSSKMELFVRELCEKMFKCKFSKVRPSWLIGVNRSPLEFDLYNENLRLAFEIQGEQHYKHIPYMHTKEKFESQQKNDTLKRKLCKQHDITLIEIKYDIKECDVEDYIKSELKKANYVTPQEDSSDDSSDDEIIVDKRNSLKKKSQKILSLIEENEGELITGVFNSGDSKYTIKCSEGHTWCTKAKYILNGAWCHTCGLDVEDKTKDKISNTLKEFNATAKGKALKKKSLEKRSETMLKAKESLRENITHKICSKCKDNKEVSGFGKKNDTKDGYQPYCKTCISDAKKKSREKRR